MKYKSLLVKFSGEAFGPKGGKVDPDKVQKIASEIQALRALGIKVAVVCGGGNVIRGREVGKAQQLKADYLGMQGTLRNVKPLVRALDKLGIDNQVYTSFSLKAEYPAFNQETVNKDWQSGKILIFAGGTGHPFFSTDTASVLRSLQLGLEVFVKATKVDGVYTADPQKNKQARKLTKLSYQKYLSKELKILDLTAVAMASSYNLPIRVVKWEAGRIVELAKGKNLGSLIS